MKDWLIEMITESNPASVVNVILNFVQIAVTIYMFTLIYRYKKRVDSMVNEGTKWLVSEAVKNAQEEHITRIYQRVDALAAAIGKEFLCNPEHLIPHRGQQPPGS